MLGVFEILLIVLILAGLFLLQIRTRTGPLVLYATIGILLLMLIFAVRVINSLLTIVVMLGFTCVVSLTLLFWRVSRLK